MRQYCTPNIVNANVDWGGGGILQADPPLGSNYWNNKP
jgi:hypothetical protein